MVIYGLELDLFWSGRFCAFVSSPVAFIKMNAVDLRENSLDSVIDSSGDFFSFSFFLLGTINSNSRRAKKIGKIGDGLFRREFFFFCLLFWLPHVISGR